jgi:hypothetical protein
VPEKRFPIDSPEPINGDITFGAFSNPLLKNIFRTFGRNAFARSSACMEFEAFLKRIGAKGKVCLEIGTYHGITAIVLSQYFDKVICVSVDNDPKALMKREIVEHLGLQNAIEFHDCTSNAHKTDIVNALDFDFAYMDGDHTHDTPEDWALVKRCGRVLFHEYWPLQAPVWNLVNSLPENEVIRAAADCFAYWERA